MLFYEEKYFFQQEFKKIFDFNAGFKIFQIFYFLLFFLVKAFFRRIMGGSVLYIRGRTQIRKKKKLVSFLNILKNSKVGPKVRNHPEKALNFLFVMGKNYKS